MTRDQQKSSGKWGQLAKVRVPLICGISSLIYYLTVAPRVSGDKDGAEVVLALFFGGVPHPTGYPLFILAGHPFVQLMNGLGLSPSYAAHAWSALGGALAVALISWITLLLGKYLAMAQGRVSMVASVAAAVLFALNPMVAIEATLAEVYSWHLAWVGGITVFWLTLTNWLWLKKDPPGTGPLSKLALAWGVVCGVGGSHHTTALFFAAPLSLGIVWLLRHRGWFHARYIGYVALGTGIPLLSYFWIWWRAHNPALFHWPALEPSLSSWMDHITATVYRNLYLGSFQPSVIQQGYLLQFIYPLLILGILGFAIGWRRAPQGQGRFVVLVLLSCVGVNLAYNFQYGVPDPVSYFLGVLMVLMPMTVLGGAVLWGGLSGKHRQLALGLASALVFGVSTYWHVHIRNHSRFLESVDRDLRSLWQKIPEGPCIVFWPDDMIHKLLIYQLIEGEKKEALLYHTLILTQPGPRKAFQLRHGFDPIQLPPGMSNSAEAVRPAAIVGDVENVENQKVGIVHSNVSARSPLPVIIFDPARGSVRLLRKPEAPVK